MKTENNLSAWRNVKTLVTSNHTQSGVNCGDSMDSRVITDNAGSNPSALTFSLARVIAVIVFAAALNSYSASGGGLISEHDAVSIIIGEAGGEPYAGQVAVAAVLRHRGSTKGFYGLKNPVVAKASPKTIAKAKRAWNESMFNDPSNGATHFENVKAFGVPKWAKGKTPCAVIGNHTFYKL